LSEDLGAVELVDGGLGFVGASHGDESVAFTGVVGVRHGPTHSKFLFHLIPADALSHPVDE